MDDYKDMTIMDVDFRVYYEQRLKDDIDIGGIYLSGSQVDLIDVISDEAKDEMRENIEYEY